MSESNANVRKLPTAEGGRVETGAIQFGSDWPGLFIRGDESMNLALALESILKYIDIDPDNFETDEEAYIYIQSSYLSQLKDLIFEDVIEFDFPVGNDENEEDSVK